MGAEQLLAENCGDNEGWRFLTERYQRYDHGTYNIRTETLNSLLLSEKILHALMVCGVRNFSEFDRAMEMAKQEDEE